MERIVLIDTNLYLDDANIARKLLNNYSKILIPITVLKELDKKKYHKDLAYSARNAIRAILDITATEKDRIVFDTEKFESIVDPDEKILAAAKIYKAVLATKDISMSIIARSMGLETILHDIVLNNIYDPYIHIHMNDLYEITEEDTFSYASEYEDSGDGDDYQDIVAVFSKLAGKELGLDHWWFVIIDINTENPVIYANHPMNQKLVRIDNKQQYREIRTEYTSIKARDCYQVCAIYALEEAPHILMTGKWGSGKSLITTAHTLSRSKRKAFITRAPVGINDKYDIGFLPGDLNEKLLGWLQGFMSSLYYLYANTRSDLDGSGRSYDYVRDRVFNEKFQIIPMNSIQGLSLLDNDTLIVDEAQLIDIDNISMIMSRPSGTSKLILLGDLKQTYDVVKPSESGLLKLLRLLPHKYLAYVELHNSYRSPLLELADELQNKTIGV